MKLKKKEQPSAVSGSKASKKKPALPPEPKYVIPGLLRPDVTPTAFPGTLVRSRKTDRDFVITLNTTAFRYAWELLEFRAAEAHKKWPSVNVRQATEDCVNAFRNSYASTMGIEAPTKKTLKKVSK